MAVQALARVGFADRSERTITTRPAPRPLWWLKTLTHTAVTRRMTCLQRTLSRSLSIH